MVYHHDPMRSRRTPLERNHWRRALVPYGIWTCADGREVLFNRRYVPLWQRYPGQEPSRADPTEWVKFVKQSWFYNDGTPETDKRRNGEAAMRQWGMTPTPFPKTSYGYPRKGQELPDPRLSIPSISQKP